MKQKEKELQEILRIMQTTGITVEDIITEQKRVKNKKLQAFDLLVVIDGVKQRVPFEQGKDCPVKLGIFPRPNNSSYIELTESDPCSCPLELEERRKFITENLADLLDDVKDELNVRLREIGAPEIDGKYWAYAHEWSGCGYYIARFSPKDRLVFTYYDEKHVAKVRRVGRFE